MERAPLRELRRHGGLVAVTFLLLLYGVTASCHRNEVSFASLLETIDSSPQDASTELFMRAATLTLGTEDKIRLLKRASDRNPDSYADIASAIAGRGNVTGPVALALLDAYLSAHRYKESLALFKGTLEASDWPSLYAETLILSLKNKVISDVSIEQLVACTDATGDDRFLVYAAVQAMTEGDRATARTLLIDSLRFFEARHSSASYELLWDAGALEPLAARSPDPADPLEIAVCADAEYLLGDIVSASTSWAYLIDRFPAWSWKPYVALARSIAAGAESSRPAWPHAPALDSWSELSAASSIEARLYSKTEKLFPDSEEASLERARWFRSRNMVDEARTIASGLHGEAAAVAALEYGLPERAVPDALRLVAEYPSSPQAHDAALEALAKAGAWERFNELAVACRSRGLQTRRGWFWDALARVLQADAGKAAEAIRNYGPEQSGYTGALNLGILELASNRAGIATEAFMIAVGLARTDHDEALAYVWAGDALRLSGQTEKATAAYEAALAADPASRDARSRLVRMKIYN